MNDDDALKALKRLIFSEINLDCQQYKDKYLKRRLMVRVRANGLSGLDEYLSFLRTHPEEHDTLIGTITINVTQFFRDSSMYHYLAEQVIPDIIYRKTEQGRRVFRVWSAGCSSGEEPYSVAILIKELLGGRVDEFQVSIHGTDIDDGSLSKAKKGVYSMDQLKNVDSKLLDTYFEPFGENYRVAREIKDMVRIKKHDLLADRKQTNFDIILNRNVMIYFSREMQERLLMDFYNSLNNGGYLIIGKTEILSGKARDVLTVISGPERIYRKDKA